MRPRAGHSCAEGNRRPHEENSGQSVHGSGLLGGACGRVLLDGGDAHHRSVRRRGDERRPCRDLSGWRRTPRCARERRRRGGVRSASRSPIRISRVRHLCPARLRRQRPGRVRHLCMWMRRHDDRQMRLREPTMGPRRGLRGRSRRPRRPDDERRRRGRMPAAAGSPLRVSGVRRGEPSRLREPGPGRVCDRGVRVQRSHAREVRLCERSVGARWRVRDRRRELGRQG